ncbi:site-specific DNA-methyltransferase [Bradyrhizobium japonicum]|uniref:site-specific DNA-methyltransferase n=1 Tax=Bradyrhizobium japonicum TaxID=375 RepID=UPI001BA803C2|nr:site-specific DNA-methyltransferase [Bradyrhizobium japonicum]MBR0734425.1 site-specific DNA-methyltransferase [Bradyrhizobium japonicum]
MSARGAKLLVQSLKIISPKRSSRANAGFEGFYPYYAGFPEEFATGLLASANLPKNALVYDPWNGSGTTTYSASKLGFGSLGCDINPVMVIVARARLIASSEADLLEPLARDIISKAHTSNPLKDDSLNLWFAPTTTQSIRNLEREVRHLLVGPLSLSRASIRLDKISSVAAVFYLILFSLCRNLTSPFRSSNPTWLRQPKTALERLRYERRAILNSFLDAARAMSRHLAQSETPCRTSAEIRLADTTSDSPLVSAVDLVLSSPPYCTRLDYTAATRIELAVIQPLLETSPEDLSRSMTGSTKVPSRSISPSNEWGATCLSFLDSMYRHPSKASKTYYFRTHLDYFDKMHRSLAHLSNSLKSDGKAVLVVQDSHYKDVHNDVPKIVAEMLSFRGLDLKRRENFHSRNPISRINPYTREYRGQAGGAVESVLCFQKL